MSAIRSVMLRMACPQLFSAGRVAAPSAAKLLGPRVALLALRRVTSSFDSLNRAGSQQHASSGEPGHLDIYQRDSVDLTHFHAVNEAENELSHHPHPIWTPEELEAVKITHHVPKNFTDRAAHYTVQAFRQLYDLATGYKFGKRDEMCYIRRIIFLETIAGVPGMVGAMVRHLNSLRRMERDYGWIHTLLEEAENERMHLMTAMLLLNKPSFLIRWSVLGAQWVFLAWYTLMYFLSPTYCHRFVGYIEEEAVKTYTGMVEAIDDGKLPKFLAPAPLASIAYWQLPANATLRDIILCIRADETHHREVNHTFAEMQKCHINPFRPGY